MNFGPAIVRALRLMTVEHPYGIINAGLAMSAVQILPKWFLDVPKMETIKMIRPVRLELCCVERVDG